MFIKTFYLSKYQIDFLTSQPGTMSEHVRRALDEYIERQKKLQVSKSPSTYPYGKTSE